MFHKVISILTAMFKLSEQVPDGGAAQDNRPLAELHQSCTLHDEARALATEAALSASTDASPAALVRLWQHDHEVHDTEHTVSKGLRHS